MSGFSIEFSNPWLLLLLIPALLITLIPYFRMNKKYRRTRNRVTSMVLHMLIMVLSISVLAGINFSYDIPNKTNEVILLVDMSYSGSENEKSRDEFVKSVIDEGGDMFRMGVVTFGYNQVLAGELTNKTDDLYEKYLNAERPDDSATDIASALNYAKTLFTRPDQGKIVIVSDGFETDGNALNTIKSIAAEGIRVDTAYFSSYFDDDVQLIGVSAPDYNIVVGDEFKLGLTLQSSYAGNAEVTLFDNGFEGDTLNVELTGGTQTVEFTHSFAFAGMHELSFTVTAEGDNLTQNNKFYSYIYLQAFDKILILEGSDNESERLRAIFDEEFNITYCNIHDGTQVPDELDELREYDQVILMNVANADMPRGFDEILYSYVYDIGGGLFTVGGSKENDLGESVPNAYNREDMYGSLFQQMLPVQAINYTPPVAVMFIIDHSGSMVEGGAGGRTKLELAKDGAKACLAALSDRDYCGVISLDTNAVESIQLTPVPQKSKIIAAIDAIEEGESTLFAPSIEAAGKALEALRNVEKKHIILITDGQPFDPLEDTETEKGYGTMIKHYNDTAGITCSIVGITAGDTIDAEIQNNMVTAAETYGQGKFYPVWDAETLPRIIREDLNVTEILEYDPVEFTPQIHDHTSVVNGIMQDMMPTLGGYYGTRLKEGADVPLMGEYVPVYAQWKFGQGMVGSFMSDLNGTWSDLFLESDTGQQLVRNIINALFPTQDIRAHDIDAVLKEDNYTNQMSIFTDLEEGQSIEITLTGPSNDGSGLTVRTITPSADEGYSRVTFTATVPGLYKIEIRKKNADGTVLPESEFVTYKTFSYSEEYNVFTDPEAARTFLAELASSGKGNAVKEGWEVFRDYERLFHFTYDPRLPFIIAAIILFLLDVAVRKFKFKWPHELIRDHKAKKEMNKED